ncbi:MAG: 2-C-methyl-D-erythritol 4-phosphate cytidylyltransferase [Actinomycetota bacterium]
MGSTGRSVEAWAVVLAAGSGVRLGRDEPKAFVSVAGRPMLEWSLLALEQSSSVSAIVLVAPPAGLDRARTSADRFGRVAAVVAGGPTRQASVRAGLDRIPPSAEVVVCHDAARPLARPDLFDEVVEALRSADVAGAVPLIPSPDTVKRVRDDRVIETIPRHELGLAQTPQAFAAAALRHAHDRAALDGVSATDDAMLLEAAGYAVAAVPGDPANLKITTEDDVARAEAVLTRRHGVSEGRARV